MSSSSVNNAKKLQDELMCPVTLELLSEAVCLVPCSHKVQQSAAETLFGKELHDGWQVKPQYGRRDTCPVCIKPVIGYLKDCSTRSLVGHLTSMPKEDIQAALEEVTKNIPKESKRVKRTKLERVPYPGRSARFEHMQGTWKYCDQGSTPLCRYLKFISGTEGSLIEGFSLLGYKNNSVRIGINFSQDNETFKEYLGSLNIHPDEVDLTMGIYTSKDDLETALLFTILAENNEIPKSHFTLIRENVEKGKHL